MNPFTRTYPAGAIAAGLLVGFIAGLFVREKSRRDAPQHFIEAAFPETFSERELAEAMLEIAV